MMFYKYLQIFLFLTLSIHAAPKAFDSLGNELETFNKECSIYQKIPLLPTNIKEKCSVFNANISHIFTIGYKLDPFIDYDNISEKKINRYLHLLRQANKLKENILSLIRIEMKNARKVNNLKYYSQFILGKQTKLEPWDYKYMENYKKSNNKVSSHTIIVNNTNKILSDDYNKSMREKIIFLTFDDGPLLGTSNILDVLKMEQVPVTMFMVAKHILKNKKIYKKAMVNPYVTIANHTYSHANGHYRKFYSNIHTLSKDIRHGEKILSIDRKPTGSSYLHPLRLAGRNVFRLPGISCDDHALGKKQCAKEHSKYDALEKEGFNIYGWDLEWSYNHNNGKPIGSAQYIVEKLEMIYEKRRYKQKDKVILLMHDFMFRNHHNGKEKLLTLIHLLKRNKWKFAHIEDYI